MTGRILGVDLASDPARTGVCVVRWEVSGAVVEILEVGATDDQILELHARCDATGIDAPFGWPVAFERLLADRAIGELTRPQWFEDAKPRLRYRLTDHVVRERTGRWPLSVSTDLIAVPALRCQGLLARMGVVDRSGDGRVFETYPAGALRRWGLPAAGYKGAEEHLLREEILARLLQESRWGPPLGPLVRRRLEADDNALDAFVCCIVARAAVLGLTEPAPPDAIEPRREGWIHLPGVGLGALFRGGA